MISFFHNFLLPFHNLHIGWLVDWFKVYSRSTRKEAINTKSYEMLLIIIIKFKYTLLPIYNFISATMVIYVVFPVCVYIYIYIYISIYIANNTILVSVKFTSFLARFEFQRITVDTSGIYKS
jgi:hypothetical protein